MTAPPTPRAPWAPRPSPPATTSSSTARPASTPPRTRRRTWDGSSAGGGNEASRRRGASHLSAIASGVGTDEADQALDELPCVHYQMLLLGGTVPVAPYRTFGTPELAESVLDALEGHTAALMANHGAIQTMMTPTNSFMYSENVD